MGERERESKGKGKRILMQEKSTQLFFFRIKKGYWRFWVVGYFFEFGAKASDFSLQFIYLGAQMCRITVQSEDAEDAIDDGIRFYEESSRGRSEATS